MEQIIPAFRWMLIGGMVGALGSGAVGAAIGLLIWITGSGFAYHWLDWPIGGGIFGIVVGAIGGTITGAILGARRERTDRRGMPVVAATALVSGSVPGILLGSSLFINKGMAEALFFGMLGGLGGAIGGMITRWIWK